MTPHRWGDLAARGSPLIRASGTSCPADRSPGLWIDAVPVAFPRRTPQWPLACRAPLTVARQRRIRTGFPSSVSYSVVRTIMRGLLVTLGDARLVEGRHFVEGADRGLE